MKVRWLLALTIAAWLLVIEFGFYLAEAYVHVNDPTEIRLEGRVGTGGCKPGECGGGGS